MLVILLVCSVITGIAVGEALAKEKKNVVMLRYRFKDKTEEAFEKVLNSSQYEINWKDYGADSNNDKLIEIINGLDLAKIDLIYVQTTNATQILKKTMEKDIPKLQGIPIVYILVTDPVDAGIVASWEHSGNNFTGVSPWVPVEAQFKVLKKVLDFKRLGMIHNPKEKNSVFQLEQAKALAKDMNFILVAANFTTKDDLDSAMRTLEEEKVDAVWLPLVTTIKANQDILLKAVNERKLPCVAAQTDLASKKDKDAALLGLGPDYYKLGELAGRKALEIFAGKKPNDIPSETLKSFDLIINLQTAGKIGKKVPVNVLKMATQIIE